VSSEKDGGASAQSSATGGELEHRITSGRVYATLSVSGRKTGRIAAIRNTSAAGRLSRLKT
jgi:hypothetical protein